MTIDQQLIGESSAELTKHKIHEIRLGVERFRGTVSHPKIVNFGGTYLRRQWTDFKTSKAANIS